MIKKIAILVLCLPIFSFAQTTKSDKFFGLVKHHGVFLDYGKSNTSFIYTDDQGNQLDNLLSESLDFSAIGYEFLPHNFKIRTALTSNKYGARSSVEDYSWSLSYIGLDLKGVYYIHLSKLDTSDIKKRGLKLLLHSGFSASWMTKGLQRIGNQVYDLSNVNNGSFNTLFMGSLGASMQYPLSKAASVSLGYSINRGVNNMETDGQSLFIQSHNLYLKLLIKINNAKRIKY